MKAKSMNDTQQTVKFTEKQFIEGMMYWLKKYECPPLVFEMFMDALAQAKAQGAEEEREKNRELMKQAWSGIVWLREMLQGRTLFEKLRDNREPTIRGRDMREVIDELHQLTQPTNQKETT